MKTQTLLCFAILQLHYLTYSQNSTSLIIDSTLNSISFHHLDFVKIIKISEHDSIQLKSYGWSSNTRTFHCDSLISSPGLCFHALFPYNYGGTITEDPRCTHNLLLKSELIEYYLYGCGCPLGNYPPRVLESNYWLGVILKYIGFELSKANKIYLGWLKIDPSMKLCEYAVQDKQVNSLSSLDNKIFISPNPTQDWLNISGIDNYSIKLFDITGQKILEEISTNNTFLTINISHIKCGMYLMIIKTKEELISKKIIKL
jgi:hypothetical protein